MFVASLALPPPTDRPLPRAPASAPLRMLIAWLIAGALLLALFPALRGGAALGATAPFWLVVAPGINLAWFARGRLAHVVLRALRRWRRPMAVQARRLQSRPRADRSSRK
jgi:hypothetical protein